MSKRKRKKIKHHTTRLVKGVFYNVHGGSMAGHPGRIEEINETNKTYLSTTTGSMNEEEYRKKPNRKNYIELKETTDNKVYKSFVNKKPFIGVRDDYGDKQYPDMKYSNQDLQKIEIIKKKKPRLGYWYKKIKAHK